MNNILTYFDLRKPLVKRKLRDGLAVPPNSSKTYVFPQYIALVLGIIIQPFLQSYQQNGQWSDLNSLLGRSVFGVVVGLVIFPAIYKNAWDPGDFAQTDHLIPV